MPVNPTSASPVWNRRSRLRVYVVVCDFAMACAFATAGASVAFSASDEGLQGPGTPSKPAAPTSLGETLLRRGNLTLRNSTIEGALFTISETWGVNVVVGENVKGTVSGIFEQAPLREVLDSILLANGYSYRAVGNSLVVQSTNDVGTANPLFRSLTIPIKHGDVKEIVAGAKLLVSEKGKVAALESAHSILIVDYADRVASVAEFVARVDNAAGKKMGGMPANSYNRMDVAYFHTQFIPAENAREPILAVLSKLGRVAIMPLENRLLVVDHTQNIQMVRHVLERIDRPRPQVRITSLIYDISLQDVEKLGLNWNSSGKGNNLDTDGVPQQALTLDTVTLKPFDVGATSGAFTIKSLTRNFDITAVLLALQTADDARLLANPNVTVMDNELAEWKSVSEIPYQQLSQTSFGGQIGTTAFKEAGITLRVKPRIAADGTIEMFVEPEFSRLAGFTPKENQPIIDSRKASTTVRVANRQTLVLGGLRQRTDTGEFNGIPLLKDLRIIGPAFRSRDTNVRESELIVFIMPEIISFDDPPMQRQFAAQETVLCKLGQIPEGEGYLSPNSDRGGPADGVDLADNPIPLPPIDNAGSVDTGPSVASRERSFSEEMLLEEKPLRHAYQSRFRATGGTDARRQRMFESESGLPPEPAEKKAPLWKRMFGS